MSSISRYTPHYTVADYEQWEGNWELWDGIAIAMVPSPAFEHQNIVMNLAYAVRNSLEGEHNCHCKVVSEVDWRIREDTVVRPDLMVLCEPIRTKWVEVVPTLIAEVLSPATRNHDLTYKRELYAREGVQHYLIVDPEQKSIETLTLAHSTYHSVRSADETNLHIELHEACRIAISLAGLWE
ncbi:MAG: Uma2 family endonuclease [Phycisphaeraceae bacterium]